MKIDRILSIMMLLLERERISATELAKLFEVSTRTIYRDIDTIALAGIPITTTVGVKGGISIMENYKMDTNVFTETDLSTLLISLGSLSTTLSSKETIGTLTKIKSLIPKQHYQEIAFKANQIAIDLSSWAGNKSIPATIECIKQGMNQQKELSFHYTNAQGVQTERQIEPYQLVLKEGFWYVQAYDTVNQAFRIFKLTRISKPILLPSTFKLRDFIPHPMNGQNWLENKIITIKLLIDPTLKEQMVDRCGEEKIQSIGNQLLVDFPFIEDDTSYGILLSYGDKCECLEPLHVRAELKTRMKKMLAVYEKDMF